MRWWSLGALALLACHGGGAKLPAVDGGATVVSDRCTIVSGTRLRANYWHTADGGKYFAGTWHDTMLGHDCAFGTVPGDTNVYCLPTSDGLSDAEFSDDQCTVPVVEIVPSCSVTSPIFALTSLTSSGNYARNFYPVEGAYTGPRWQQSSGGCQPATDPAPAGYELHTVGAPLDKSTFVVATPYTATAPTRLQATGFMSPDGAIQACSAVAFFDSQRNESCDAGSDSNGLTRCLPGGVSLSGAGMFSDPACMSAAAPLSSNPAPSYEAVTVPLVCGVGTQLNQLSGPLTAEYTNSSGTCALVSPTLPGYYTAGAEVTPENFVALTEKPLAVGGQRLQEIVDATDDGFGMPTGMFSDSHLGGATCQFSTASDGTVRCLPGDPSNPPKIGSEYLGSCTTPISIVVPECDGTLLRFAQILESPSATPSCTYQAATRVFAVGAAVAGTLYEVSGSSCVDSPYSGDAYELGAEQDPSMFVQATLVAD